MCSAQIEDEDLLAVVDNLPTLCWIADTNGSIFWFNRRWQEYTGLSVEVLLGWGRTKVHAPDRLPEVLKAWGHSIETGAPFEMTFPLRGRDGIFRPFLTRIVPLKNQEGSIIRWLGTNVDVSAQVAVNARDAMPSGGKLTIETANAHIDEGYAATQAEVIPGQYVVICVSDTGVGMDKNTIAQVFEPFFTTKEPGKGTGLGLSQVYGFVKQSGGHVKLYSELAQGTTVKIYLPRLLIEDHSVDDARVQTIAPEGTTEETILVVEDDDDVRTYSVDILRELGYRVIEAHDGPSALRLLERQTRVDLLFTDVVLPSGLTGAEVAAEVRKRRPEIKVLFTTGYARNAIVHHGRLDAGVNLIPKPFTYALLAAKVRDVLDSSK